MYLGILANLNFIYIKVQWKTSMHSVVSWFCEVEVKTVPVQVNILFSMSSNNHEIDKSTQIFENYYY